MQRRFPLWLLAVLIIFISAANAIADYWHLYVYIWWLDIPMHILGGFWVATTGLVAYYASSRWKMKDRSALFVVCAAIALALTVGLGWEIYEYSVDHIVLAYGNNVGDTLKDLFDDLIGALFAAALFLNKGYNKHL